MSNILAFLWLQTKRRFVSYGQEKRVPLLIMLLFIGSAGIQLGFLSRTAEWDVNTAGWVLIGIFILYTAFGLFSNRLPSRMADVVWLYRSSSSFTSVVYAVLLFSFIWKALLWVLSAMLSDIVLLLFSGEHANLTGKSLVFVLLILLGEVWMMAVSSARAVKKTKRIFTILLLAMLSIYFICLYQFYFHVSPSSIWLTIERLISEVGWVFNMTYSPMLLLSIGVTFIVSFGTLQFTTNQLEMKENLVKEAEFWEEFQERQAGSGHMMQKPQQTWWGMEGLNGIWSLLWLELLLVKKHLFFHLFHLLLLFSAFAYVIFRHPEWFSFLFFLVMATVFLSSYYAGIVRHAQSGDLYLFPGAPWKKIILLELANTAWFVILYGLSIKLLSMEEPLYWYVYGFGVYVWMMTVRLIAFTQTIRQDIRVSLPVYYKTFFITALFGGGCLYLIHRVTAGWITPAVMVLTGIFFWYLFYRFRHKMVLMSVGGCVIILFIFILLAENLLT